MKIYVVRHGETNYNILGLHNSDPNVDVHLTDTGIIEAKHLAEELKNQPFDAIFVSELPRTKQTANYINKYHQLPLQVDPRLNDIRSGFEGKKVSDYHTLRDASDDAFIYKYPDGESSQEVYNRTKDFIDYLKNTKYQNILIVTSKHNHRHFRNIIDGIDPRESLKHYVKNAEILIREI